MPSMAAGEAAIYAFGLTWLALFFSGDQLASFVSKGLLSSPTRLAVIWEWGVKDFIIGDTIKLVMAALAVPMAWAGIQRLRGQEA